MSKSPSLPPLPLLQKLVGRHSTPWRRARSASLFVGSTPGRRAKVHSAGSRSSRLPQVAAVRGARIYVSPDCANLAVPYQPAGAAATSALSTLQHQNFSAYPTTSRVPSSWST